MRILVASALGVALIAVGGVGGYLVGKNDTQGSQAEVGGLSALPAGWNLCTNVVHRFAIGYPGGWHEEHLTREEACAFIDPKPFKILRGKVDGVLYGVFYGTALEVDWIDFPTKYAVRNLIESDGYCPQSGHSVEQVSVGGFRAIRVEAISTDGAVYACGTRVYAYFVTRRKGALVVETVTEPGVPGYSKRKRVVDAAVRTLYFFKPKPKPKPGFCHVPKVIGSTLRHAKTRIRNSECGVGRIRRARSNRVGLVIGQLPRPGATKPGNYPVKMVVGRR
jgi:hypothetical protein